MKAKLLPYIKIFILFLIFLVLMIIKRYFIPSSLIFYEGIFITLILSLIVFFFKILKIEFVIIFSLISILFWSLGPTIFDRSVSITVLGRINYEKTGVTIENINSDFVDIYLTKNLAIKKRLNEQMASGNVVVNDGKYILTSKGKNTVIIIKKLTNIFNIDSSYITR
jgi:hypothetical protein